MKIIEKLRWKLGLWLIQTKTMTATSVMLRERVNTAKCIHCGKNPYFKDKE